MRRVFAIGLAAALAACRVNLEGAPCAQPGTTTDCPSGQACGNDLTCGKRAAGCVVCKPNVDLRCGDHRREKCTASDPVCGAWVLGEDCGDLVCNEQAGYSCGCPTNAVAEFVVDQRAPSLPVGVQATGVASPPRCRYTTLGQGLAAANALVAAGGPGTTATVRAVGASSGATVTFSAAGEQFPLDVNNGVTLTSDRAASGGAYEILFDAVSPPPAPIRLHSGGTLADFTVRNGTGDVTRQAVVLQCDGNTAPAHFNAVVLDGKNATTGLRLGHGLVVENASTCGVVASDLDIKEMSVAALTLGSPGIEVALTRGSMTNSGEGIFLNKGRLFLDGVRIAGNEKMGIRADDFSGSPRIEIRASKVIGNHDTGIALVNASEVRITSTTIFGNGAVTSWGGGALPSGASRKSGGVVLWGTPPSAENIEFGRNRIYANSGDQVLVLGTAASWMLNASGCGSDSQGPIFNVFACYDTTSPGPGVQSYRGVVAVDAIVSPNNAAWASVTPSRSVDFFDYGTGASVTIASYCPPDTSLSCTSEDPVP